MSMLLNLFTLKKEEMSINQLGSQSNFSETRKSYYTIEYPKWLDSKKDNNRFNNILAALSNLSTVGNIRIEKRYCNILKETRVIVNDGSEQSLILDPAAVKACIVKLRKILPLQRSKKKVKTKRMKKRKPKYKKKSDRLKPIRSLLPVIPWHSRNESLERQNPHLSYDKNYYWWIKKYLVELKPTAINKLLQRINQAERTLTSADYGLYRIVRRKNGINSIRFMDVTFKDGIRLFLYHPTRIYWFKKTLKLYINFRKAINHNQGL